MEPTGIGRHEQGASAREPARWPSSATRQLPNRIAHCRPLLANVFRASRAKACAPGPGPAPAHRPAPAAHSRGSPPRPPLRPSRPQAALRPSYLTAQPCPSREVAPEPAARAVSPSGSGKAAPAAAQQDARGPPPAPSPPRAPARRWCSDLATMAPRCAARRLALLAAAALLLAAPAAAQLPRNASTLSGPCGEPGQKCCCPRESPTPSPAAGY